MISRKNILITGFPGSGKTTLIQIILQELDGELGLRGGGFYTKEIRKKDSRMGFSLVTLDGVEALLAHVEIRSGYSVGKYGVDIEALDNIGVAAIKEAIDQKDIVVVDEIGKMELYSQKFQEAVLQALNGDSIVLATIGRINHPFVQSVKKRKDLYILEANRKNQDCLKTKIIDLIRGALKE